MQSISGVTAEEFEANPIAVAAWKATVAIACAQNESSLIRVDITSIDTVDSRRLLSSESSSAVNHQHKGSAQKEQIEQEEERVHHRNLHAYSNKRILSGLKINFQVSYTLQDFKNANVNLTTLSFKSNYEHSVANNTFVKVFAQQCIIRTTVNDTASQSIIDRIVPAEVSLAATYTVIQTTASPSFRPTASPTTGKIGVLFFLK